MIIAILVSALVLSQLYYWLIYFPKAWTNPGTNREIDDIRTYIKYKGENK